MAGSTVPSPAPSLWTRPRALQPTRRSRIRNLITGRTQVFQQSQVKLEYLAEIEIDPNSLVVLERTQNLPPPGFRDSSATIPFNYNTKDDSFSDTTGKCMPFDVPFCKELPYNFTIYPNGFGHRNVESLAPRFSQSMGASHNASLLNVHWVRR